MSGDKATRMHKARPFWNNPSNRITSKKDNPEPDVHQRNNARSGLDVKKYLDELLVDRPEDDYRLDYHEQKSRMENRAEVTEFLKTTHLSQRAVGWVLNRIPEDSGLGWLLQDKTENLLLNMSYKKFGDGTFSISSYELNLLFRALDEERSKRRNIDDRDRKLLKEARDSAKMSAASDLFSLMKDANPDVSIVLMQDIAKRLNMSTSSLRSKKQDDLDRMMERLDFDAVEKTWVQNAFDIARLAQNGRRKRIGASYTPNPYFV